MDWYQIIKTIHIISSTVLFGTGAGIAFFMYRSQFTEDVSKKYYAIQNTVLADYLFTFPAVLIQPLSGFWLILHGGYNWTDSWLMVTYALYIVAGLCWIPVVWIQIQLKNILAVSIEQGTEPPERYHKLFRLWLILGWPAFIGLIVIFFLMVFKPV